MTKKLILIFALALMLLLAACERSAVSPQATPTVPGGSQATVALPEAYKTQTAAGTITALYLTMQPGAQIATITGGIPPTPTITIFGAPTLTPINTLVPTVGGNPNAPTPTPGRPATYTLQEGEFPYCIARRFNVDPDELIAMNSLTSGELFQPGKVLTIPATGNAFPAARALHTHPATYTVRTDDTIYKIACYFGDVDPIYLAAFNGLVAPYTLTTGRVLNVP